MIHLQNVMSLNECEALLSDVLVLLESLILVDLDALSDVVLESELLIECDFFV